jgi:hypothetical protein
MLCTVVVRDRQARAERMGIHTDEEEVELPA